VSLVLRMCWAHHLRLIFAILIFEWARS